LVAPDFATIPEILSSLKISRTPSRVLFRLRTAVGEEVTQEFTPLALNASPTWIDVFDARQVARPLYLRQPEKHYWFEYLEGQRTVYARISAILDSPELSTAAFSRDLFAFIGSHAVDRLVLDLRESPGGNNQLFRALLLGLIRETSINQPGKLFVLIDRGTFSAAVSAATDLEYLTNSIFIGEPTAGAPSSWGDPKRLTLPNSGLVARLSSVYWRDSTPDASRTAVTPDIPTPLSSADYFAGRDPALEAANGFPKQTGFGEIIENVLKSGGGLGSLQRLYAQRKSDPAWAGESTKGALQQLGIYLISKKLYQGAFMTFAANMREYPDSLVAAIQAAEAAQARDTNDKGAADLVNRLSALRGQR
jgi:Peptidase family S41